MNETLDAHSVSDINLAQVPPKVIILVNVANMPPYPELFESGPKSTWINSGTPEVLVLRSSGLPIPRKIRPVIDLRDMLRFPGARPSEVGTVMMGSLTMRAYGLLTSIGLVKDVRHSPWFTKLIFRARSVSLLTLNRIVAKWEERSFCNKRRFRPALVTQSDGEVIIHRMSTVSNSMLIQRDLFTYFANAMPSAGIIYTTASAYIDQQRLMNWISGPGQDALVAGSSSSSEVIAADGSSNFFSGFFQYFSASVVRELAIAKDLDLLGPNDISLTRWLKKRGISWVDPGIIWSAEELDQGICPLCANSEKFVVRCTSHGSREREQQYMSLLFHQHGSSQEN